MTERASAARRVATRVLQRVTTEGAWATPALDAEIGRAGLDRRDAALATEITYGALRVLPELDRALDAHLNKPKKVDPYLRAALRAAAYQLLYLRVPSHAAVSDAVALVKRERGPRRAGVANPELRQVAAARPPEPSPPERIEVPAWIAEAFGRALGPERAKLFLAARPLPPPIGLRAVSASAEDDARAIREARPDAEVATSALAPRAIAVRGAGDPRTLPGFADGHLAVQELGSQLVVELVGARAGERIADLCAGHGVKSLALAERVEGGEVVSIDLYEEKLERALRERERLAITARMSTMALDLTVGTGGLGASFDRVLVDAPCTGLGTVHRRPEIVLRLGPSDPARMAELQTQIVRTAAGLVRPGGVLVYAVCSPTEEEGRGVADALEAALPELERVREPLAGDPIRADDDGIVRIGPWNEGADAYQVVRWIRRAG